MNLLDLCLLAIAAMAAVGGYRLGFLTRTVSWIGMGIGLLSAARALPWFIDNFSGESPLSLLLFAGILLLVGSFIGQALGVLIGSRLRFRLPSEDWRGADHVMGAAAGLIGAAACFWLLLPAMSSAPGFFAQQTRQSVIARGVDRLFPEAPDTLLALRQIVGEDQFPRVFDALTPAPDIGPPPGDPGLPDGIAQQVTASTVKVSGPACNRVQEGSGFVALGPDVVITNAHVVAGQDETQVERSDGTVFDAFVVAFDPNRDLAILRVPGLDRSPLPIADGGVGATGGVFGHPGGAPLRIAPFVVGDEVRAVGTDIYDSRRTERQVLILASQLRPGDSGAALVDGSGAVVGVAFAIAPDDPDVAYGLDTSELDAVVGGDLVTPIDTGPCLR